MKMTASESIPPSLWQAFDEGSRRACARLITTVENDPSAVAQVRHHLAPRLGKSVRIGITGPPGVGKSTLTAALAEELANAGHRIGIIAVDPSSPFTGGAFMGDRVRMDKLAGDPRIYIRSMASRDGKGGLSPATPFVADVIEGFGMDRILIETVGVGQAELDVLACADLVILVLQPSTGDAIQTMKAGIIEAADLIVVNKSDIPGVDTVLQSLRFLFSLSGPLLMKRGHGSPMENGAPKVSDRRTPPILATSAQQTKGIQEVASEIERLTADLIESGKHREIRRKRIAQEMREGVRSELWRRFAQAADADRLIEQKASELADSNESPYPFIIELTERITPGSNKPWPKR